MKKSDELLFFAVRNKERQWFHRKGYGGTGDSWTDSLRGARIYNKIGYARAQAQFFAENFPDYPTPKIVEFKVIESREIDVTEEIKKKRAKEEKKAGIQRLERARKIREEADQEVREAEQALKGTYK